MVHWSLVIPNVGQEGLWTAAVKSDDIKQTGEDGYKVMGLLVDVDDVTNYGKMKMTK